jgi:hypothetical protein
VSAQTLTFTALVGLPLVAAIFLGLLARVLVGGGSAWLVWLVGVIASCVLWGLVFWGVVFSEAA